MTNNKPTGAELRAQVQEAEALLQRKQAELSRIIQAAEDASVHAIVTGKKSLAPALQTKARQLQEEVQVATESLQTLSKALALIEAEEAGQAAEAERSRVAHLMTGYRDRLGRLVQAIESGNDAMAPYRIQVAEAELAEVCLQIPPKSRPPAFVVQNPSMIVLDPAMRLGFLETICHAGFAELLPKDIGLGFSSTTNEGTIEENNSVWVGTAKPAARLPTIRSFQTKCLGFRAVRRRWHTDKNSSCFQEAGRGSPFS